MDSNISAKPAIEIRNLSKTFVAKDKTVEALEDISLTINEGEIYEIIGDKPRAIANYLAAARLFSANNFFGETTEYANKVLSLDPTNVEAKELLNAASN